MKIGMISLGCPKNLVDSEVMLGLAQQSGHELTRDAADADVLVVNTCAFIDKAKQESIDAILEMAEHKKTGQCTKLIVTGCMGERYRDELRAQIPEIDAVLGTGEIPEIVDAIGGNARSREQDPASQTGFIPLLRSNGERVGTRAPKAVDLPTYIYDADTPRLLATHPDPAREVPEPAR
jgi:ribosomal protein S12 methylthiotransferase